MVRARIVARRTLLPWVPDRARIPAWRIARLGIQAGYGDER